MLDTNSDWYTFYQDGAKLHKTTRGSIKRPEIFTPLIIENLAAMSIEKYFMAIFLSKDRLPANHTLQDLYTEAQTFIALDPSLVEILEYMNSLQQICSVFEPTVIPAQESDIPKFLKAVEMVSDLAKEQLGIEA